LFDIDDRGLIYLADRSVGFDTCSCAIEVGRVEGEPLPLSLRASASSVAARSVSPLSA